MTLVEYAGQPRLEHFCLNMESILYRLVLAVCDVNAFFNLFKHKVCTIVHTTGNKLMKPRTDGINMVILKLYSLIK